MRPSLSTSMTQDWTQRDLAGTTMHQLNAVKAALRRVYDPGADAAFPAGMRAVAFRKPSWSEDGAIVFLGVAKWNEKPAVPKKAAASGGSQVRCVTRACASSG